MLFYNFGKFGYYTDYKSGDKAINIIHFTYVCEITCWVVSVFAATSGSFYQ